MLGHYLLTLYRSLTRHRLYAALNVAGLGVGIAVFLVLALLVRFETSFDRWLPNAANIYRLTADISLPGLAPEPYALTPPDVLPQLRADYPRIMAGARIVFQDLAEPVSNGKMLANEKVAWCDPDLFNILDLPLIVGDPRAALASPDDIVVSPRIAAKYFGAAKAIGRRLTITMGGEARLYRVSAVLKALPANTHLSFDILAPITPAMQGHLEMAYTYLRFHDPREARALAADLRHFVARHAPRDMNEQGAGGDVTPRVELRMTPLTGLHFADAKARFTMTPGADPRMVYALGVLGALTLLIAAANYVNLATARAAIRAREIALRKTMGATRRMVAIQLLLEAQALAALAALIGVALAELALPTVNALDGTSLRLTYVNGTDGILPWLILLTISVGLGAGLYPALLLSRFQPAAVLASAQMPGGGRAERRARSTLTGAQFAGAIVFTVCALVIAAQSDHLRHADRGFNREGLILVDSLQGQELRARQTTILDLFRRTPGVVSVTEAISEPGLPNEAQLEGVRRAGDRGVGMTMDGDVVGDDYLQTLDARLLAGRMFDRLHSLDDTRGGDYRARAAGGYNIVLNQRAARLLGFSDPALAVGRTIHAQGISVPVIGVISDIHFGSPLKPPAAILYRYSGDPIELATGMVRYAGVSERDMMGRLASAWRRAAPEIPFKAKTAEDGLADFYAADQRQARLFVIAAGLAVAISCIGLYGLAAFSTARRFREIGIRKTLGASTFDILALLMSRILGPVLIANLIAWPIAFLVMRQWLAGFDQRIWLSPLYFLTATALTLIVAIATVAGHAYAAARAEPAKALRHE